MPIANLSSAPGVANSFEIASGAYLNVFADGGNHLLLSGPLTSAAGTGHLHKSGSATLTLSGANTYTGTTTVVGGTLACNSAAALGQGPVVITSGKLSLNYTGTRQVATLSLGGIAQPSGTYGSTASPATNKNDTYFNGSGVLNVGPAASVPFTWNTATTNSWGTAGSWTSGTPTAAGQSNYALNFNVAGSYTASNNLNAGFIVNQLNFGGSSVTLAGNSLAMTANVSTAPQLSQNSTSPVTVSNNLSLNATTIFGGTSSGTITLTGVVSGYGGLIKSCTGDVTLNGANTYTGGTTVNAGNLHVGLSQNAALGSGAVTLNAGSTLRLNRVTMNNSLVINGAKLSATNGFGDAWSGPISLSSTSTFDLETTGSLNISGAISGSGSLTKIGNGTTLTLSGTGNTYSGGTIVSGGTISCSSVDSLGQGSVAVASGARLNLAFSGTRQVSTLSLGGAGQPSGTYGSTASSATYKNNTYFSGTGVLNVTSSLAGGMALSQSAPAMTAGSTDTPPPLPWASGSIGSGMVSGSTSYNAGTVSQSGSGALGSTSDKLNFCYQTLSGDGEITAKISALQDTGTLSGVGVMIRETLAPNSKHVLMGMSGGNTYRMVSRTTTGGVAISVSSGTGTVPNTWVKLVRVGDVITASKSTDGATWVSVGSTTVTMASSCYIGLAVSSGSDTTLNSSQFSNLSVTP